MNVTCFSVVPCRSKKLGGKNCNYGRLNTQKIIQFRKAGEDGYNLLNLRSKQSTVNHEHRAKLAKAASHVTGKKKNTGNVYMRKPQNTRRLFTEKFWEPLVRHCDHRLQFLHLYSSAIRDWLSAPRKCKTNWMVAATSGSCTAVVLLVSHLARTLFFETQRHVKCSEDKATESSVRMSGMFTEEEEGQY